MILEGMTTGHAGDLFLHVLTGGANPIEMHEYIVHKDPGVVLEYMLEPAKTGSAYAATA